MDDLAAEMAALAERLGPPPGARGRVVQFLAADAAADAAEIARAFALEMTRRAARGVWLVELDLLKSAQHRHFEDRQDQYGALGPPARASPGEDLPFTVTPKDPAGPADGAYVYAQSVGRRRLYVTRFRREVLRPGQSVKILADGAYWEALRPHADYVVVDAPALDRSPAGLAAAPYMDDNVLVLSGRSRNPGSALEVKRALAVAGARCSGLVLRDAPPEPPAFLMRLLS
jgi:Mrp family chromosome partitioning ATPase